MKNTIAIVISGMFIWLSAMFSEKKKDEKAFVPDQTLVNKKIFLENKRSNLEGKIETGLLMQGYVLDTLVKNKQQNRE